MIGPLMVLGLLSLAGGFIGFPPEHGWLHQFLNPVAARAASTKSVPAWYSAS